ncbi:MFS transporter [Nocardiopsis tropica]|uniref:MFS transporter n=1 Tax=Nocardiopsis tropica TaxID=109330 RepID=A0ABU7KP92_9ACTN|nr:MFS transporter [Nocardiopsis umidischolae]MEE2051121.1 MFS transporter [Nocardiopsis umidischolae]
MTQAAERSPLPTVFWRMMGATGLNAVGQGVFAAALPLLAITITSDPRMVSSVLAVVYLPWLALSLPVGAFVDRYDRARLLWCSQALQALIAGIIALLLAFGSLDIIMLLILAFAMGACQVVIGNVAQTILPDILEKSSLSMANGYQQTIVNVGQQFVGPPLGSFFFAMAVALPFGIDVAVLVLAAVLLFTLPRAASRRVERLRLGRAIADGFLWLVGHRLLRTLAILLGINTFCFHLGNATLVLFATQELSVAPAGYGLLLAAAAVGGVVAGLLCSRIVDVLGARVALLGSLGINAVVFIAVGMSPHAVALGALLAVNGFCAVIWSVITVSMRQKIVPSDLLGRVNSIYRMVGWGLIPLGVLAGGFLAHWLGLRSPYPIGGCIRGVSLLVAAPVIIRAMRV